MVLTLAQINKTYTRGNQAVKALTNLSLTLTAGEFLAIQGASGCGKTTLLLTAGGLLSPDSGIVHIGGTDPYALPPEKGAALRATNVGFVFQQFHLVPYLTARENILAPTLARPISDARNRADLLLEKLDLTARADHCPAELSMGERQRTALARALLGQPKLILADEPTGNLDPENSDRILTELATFAKAGGAVILATHDPAGAKHAHRTLTMAAGSIP